MVTLAKRPAHPRPALLLSLLLTLPLPATAAEAPPVELAAMARRAGVVAAGQIVQVRPGAHPRSPRLGVTFVTLRVSEGFKGTRPGLFTFMQVGHAGDVLPPAGGPRFMVIPDLPTYRPGEEVLLFLYPATETGLTSPVDGRRGKRPLVRDARSGEPMLGDGVLTAVTPFAQVRSRLRAVIAGKGGTAR